MNVYIDHAVANQQVAFQAVGKVNRGGAVIGQRIGLGFVENVGRVAMVIGRPIGNGPESRASRKFAGGRKHGHQGNEPAIGAAINPDSLGIHPVIFRQPISRIHMVGKVFATHKAVDTRAPVASVTRRPPVINVEYGIALIDQQVMKHILSKILTPPLMSILQIARTMHKHYRFSVGLHGPVGFIQSGINRLPVPCRDHDDLGFSPRICLKISRLRIS